MKKITTVSQADWLKLHDYAKIAAKEISKKLQLASKVRRHAWHLTEEEITSYVLGVIAHLIDTYKEGAMSLTSYCYTYAKPYALRDILREYNRLSRQLDICSMLDPDDEDGKTHHEYIKDDVQAITVDGHKMTETQIVVKDILDKATPEDRAIMQEIMQGYSYEEIAKRHNTDKKAITRRMRRYGKGVL